MRYLLAILILTLQANVWAGASRNFDGVGDSIAYTKPSGLTVGTDSFTMIEWIFWTNGPDNDDEVIVSQADGTGTGRTWAMIDDNGVECGTADELCNFLGNNTLDTTKVISASVWTHIAAQSNETLGTTVLFSDAVQVGSETATVEAATGVIRVGGAKAGGNTYADFEGQIAYAILCEGALTVAQLSEIMYSPDAAFAYCGSNLYVYSPLFGLSSPEQDLSGNGTTGTLTGTAESSNGPPILLAGGLPL